MTEYVQKDDVTPHQAINITKDILFNNSNVLYNLRYTPDFKEFVEPPKPIAWHPKPNTPFSPSPQSTTKAPDQHPTLESEGTRYAPPMFPPPPKTPQIYDIQLFEEFMQHNPDIKFVYVQWLDYMATIRARILPIREFRRMIQEGERISISQGNTGTLQNDGITPVVNPVGQIYIEPDLRSLRRTHKKDPLPAATVLSFWRDDQGQPSKECPRSNLELLVQELDQHHDISLLCGFEIEVTFLNRNTTSTKASEPYTPLTVTHAWGTLTPDDWLQLPMLAEIADALEDIGIDIQQFHSESGPGQYEFILPPLPPLPAIDTLIQARQVIFQIAALHGLRATLHPKPFPGAATAAHAHISLNRGVEHAMPFFVGGVLRHLPAICAFSMPEAVSYERVVDGAWTGGTWVAWGTQNRETPLRRVDAGHWEVRCIDGMANMYFTLSAILAAGILGLKSAPVAMPTGTIVTTTPWYPERDVPVNPSRLSDEQRLAYGIREKMSASIEEAMVALDRDGELREMLAEGLVYDYLAMKRSELEMLGKMDERERRVWLIERY
jgi:glutamine synthetase